MIKAAMSKSRFLSKWEAITETTKIKLEEFKRDFIIIYSVKEPLPPETENVEYMPNGTGIPQLIPNAKFSDPIIITKMPHG